MSDGAAAPDSPGLRVLVADDEKNIRQTLALCLESLGCVVTAAGTGEAAREAATRARFDLAFVDLKLGRDDGLDLIAPLLAENPSMAIVVVTAYGTIDSAVEAIRRGARDYITKPFSPEQVRHAVDRERHRRGLEGRLQDLEAQLEGAVPEIELATASPRMEQTIDTLFRAAGSDIAVLLRGESGTGKSVLARALHVRSRRARAPFVVVNCPTLSEDLLASELFGCVRGAFTGAVADRLGRVEAADGGTVFLDEIGEIPPALQAKLLRFIQDKEFERLGDPRTRRADVRIVAATNRDLEADVRDGRFREDLLYRLNVVEVTVPPLRERREDVVPLARRFAAFFAATLGRPAPTLSPAAEEALRAHAWPGNVRELRNVVEHAVLLWPAAVVEPHAFPERLRRRGGGPGAATEALEDVEREHVLKVLASAPTLEEAAERLGIDVSTLWRKRKKYGV